MFRIFDDDNSGTIDFEEFILALNATKSGILIIFMTTFISVTVRMTTPDQKLQWIFNVFDRCKCLSLFPQNRQLIFLTRDGGGTIDAQEIHEMVLGLFAMSGMEVSNNNDDEDYYDDHTKVSSEEADACTQEILEAIDVDKDGDVTKVREGVRTIYILMRA